MIPKMTFSLYTYRPASSFQKVCGACLPITTGIQYRGATSPMTISFSVFVASAVLSFVTVSSLIGTAHALPHSSSSIAVIHVSISDALCLSLNAGRASQSTGACQEVSIAQEHSLIKGHTGAQLPLQSVSLKPVSLSMPSIVFFLFRPFSPCPESARTESMVQSEAFLVSSGSHFVSQRCGSARISAAVGHREALPP